MVIFYNFIFWSPYLWLCALIKTFWFTYISVQCLKYQESWYKNYLIYLQIAWIYYRKNVLRLSENIAESVAVSEFDPFGKTAIVWFLKTEVLKIETLIALKSVVEPLMRIMTTTKTSRKIFYIISNKYLYKFIGIITIK